MLDLLSSLKETKSKTLKPRGHSETQAGRQSRRAAGQRRWSRNPLDTRGETRLLHHKLRGLTSDQKKEQKISPKPLTRGVSNDAHQTTSRHDEPNLENATRERISACLKKFPPPLNITYVKI